MPAWAIGDVAPVPKVDDQVAATAPRGLELWRGERVWDRRFDLAPLLVVWTGRGIVPDKGGALGNGLQLDAGDVDELNIDRARLSRLPKESKSQTQNGHGAN